MAKIKVDEMKRRCPVHKVELKEDEANCWRCKTRSLKNLKDHRKVASGKADFIIMKQYPSWIGMN